MCLPFILVSQLSLHPEMEVLRQRVLGFEARGEEQASACGTEPLSDEELRAAASASSESVPVGTGSPWGLVCVCSEKVYKGWPTA